MAHLFFSYAHKDAERIYPIHRKMEAILGRKMWIDRIGLRQGIEWENAIKRGIDQSYGVIFAVTKTFVTRDFILKKEIPWSIDTFKDRQGPLLFVLRLDDVELPPDLKALPDYQCQVIDAYASDANLEAICNALKLPAEQEGNQPFYVSWPRLQNFKGRDQTLDNLHQQLIGGAVGVNSRISAGLYGMGGIGKTQLAVEYAYRYRYYYPTGVYWINAAADWSQELVALADRLGLEPTDKSDSDRARQKIIALERYLKQQASNEDGDALIVMDNVETPKEVTTRKLNNGATMIGVASSFCAQARARLLITTRRQDLPEELAKVEINVLDPRDARDVLLDARPTESDTAGIDELCKAVGYLPLPLGWFAAALRKRPKLTPSQLRNELRRQGIENVISVLRKQNIELGTPQEYEALTGIAFNWQYNSALQANTDAKTLLSLAAAFPEAAQIPLARLRLLSGLSAEESLDLSPFESALQALIDSSLVELLNEAQLRLHPLVREFVRSKVDTQSALRVGAERIVEAYRTPQVLADEAEARGFDALLSDLRETDDAVSTPLDSLIALKRLFLLEEPNLITLPEAMGGIFVIQQIRDRAYHEVDATLVSICDNWLNGKAHINHIGPSHYPKNKALLRILSKHTGRVNGALALDDGRLLSWAGDKTLRLWSRDGQALTTLEGHTGSVTGALALDDGRLLSWAGDNTLRLWSRDGQALTTLEGHTGSVNGALARGDGRLLSWAGDKTLRLWSSEGQALTTLEGHTGSVNGALALDDGRLLSWAGEIFSSDNTLRLWSSEGQALTTLEGHTSRVNGALARGDGRQLSWSDDKTLRLWSSQGTLLLVYYTDAPISCCVVAAPNVFLVGNGQGHVLFLRVFG
ncbi:MAG: TIR domain-containing protein [Anaerolineae bacterium]|nr:TIR domain-containing protein [Anaerolineae bacterium]